MINKQVRVKPIPGYEGIYEIHDDGTIWVIPHITLTANGLRRHVRLRKLKFNYQYRKKRDAKGVLRRETKREVSITLRRHGEKPKTFYVHRLLAQAFIPNPHHLPEVNHIDGNPENNDLSNLEWVDSTTNQKHAEASGLLQGVHVKLIDKCGRVFEFNSQEKASQFLKLDIGSVFDRYPNKRMILGYKVILETDDANVDYDYQNFERGNKMLTLTDENGLVHQFRSFASAGEFLGMSSGFLGSWLRKYPLNRKINGFILELASDDDQTSYNYDNYLTKSQNKSIRLENVKIRLFDKNDTMYAFDTLSKASLFLGCKSGYLSKRFSVHPLWRMVKGYRIELSDDDLNQNYDYENHEFKVEVQLINANGVIKKFDSLANAGRYLGLTPAHMHGVHGRAQQKKVPCFVNNYELKMIRVPY